MKTDVQDLVLIHISDKPTIYARLEAIKPDLKPGWWRVELLILTIPPQEATWILEREQIDGSPFTLDGTPIRLQKVSLEGTSEDKRIESFAVQEDSDAKGKVIFLKDQRKQP